MQKKCVLVPFPLWGEYEGVTLHLELTPDRGSMKRFILFSPHPQYFMYHEGKGPRALEWRRRYGAPQDRMLDAAARIGCIKITTNFYELDSRVSQHRTETFNMSFKKRIEREAMKELEMAAPEPIFVPYNPTPISSCKEDVDGATDILIQANAMNLNTAMTNLLVWQKTYDPQDPSKPAETKPGRTTDICQAEDDIQEKLPKQADLKHPLTVVAPAMNKRPSQKVSKSKRAKLAPAKADAKDKPDSTTNISQSIDGTLGSFTGLEVLQKRDDSI